MHCSRLFFVSPFPLNFCFSCLESSTYFPPISLFVENVFFVSSFFPSSQASPFPFTSSSFVVKPIIELLLLHQAITGTDTQTYVVGTNATKVMLHVHTHECQLAKYYLVPTASSTSISTRRHCNCNKKGHGWASSSDFNGFVSIWLTS